MFGNTSSHIIHKKDLEDKVYQIVEGTVVPVERNDIDDCYRFQDNEGTIVKFLRKDHIHILR